MFDFTEIKKTFVTNLYRNKYKSVCLVQMYSFKCIFIQIKV